MTATGPFWTDSSGLVDLYAGDVLDVLACLPAASVQCCVTSPPYFALRDYGTAAWEGGDDPACDHKGTSGIQGATGQRADRTFTGIAPQRGICTRCGATRIDQQIGLEATPEAYIAKMVTVFRAVWRVLRDDGTLWLNIGDSYAGSWGNYGAREGKQRDQNTEHITRNGYETAGFDSRPATAGKLDGLKAKDLIGIPWMLAFALRADGWYLRSDIIWHKPNPMPESVTDRPTKSHEYLFLLTKSAHYFFDNDAIREPHQDHAPFSRFGNVGKNGGQRGGFSPEREGHADEHVRPVFALRPGGREYNPAGRNRRTVWTIATQSYGGAHFATFPEALVEPCILAGTSERGCCPACGAPWVRVTEKLEAPHDGATGTAYAAMPNSNGHRISLARQAQRERGHEPVFGSVTTGWQPSCACPPADPIPCVVLDPFVGSGTTVLVAKRLVRRAVGIDLNAEYLKLAQKRVKSVEPGVQLDLLPTSNPSTNPSTGEGANLMFALEADGE